MSSRARGLLSGILIICLLQITGCSIINKPESSAQQTNKDWQDLTVSTVFEGESANWKAEINDKFSEKWPLDEQGKRLHKSWWDETGKLQYTGSNPEEIGEVKYRWDRNWHKASGSVQPDRNGIIDFNHSGGEGVAFDRDAPDFTITVEWGKNNIETLRLECIEKKETGKFYPSPWGKVLGGPA